MKYSSNLQARKGNLLNQILKICRFQAGLSALLSLPFFLTASHTDGTLTVFSLMEEYLFQISREYVYMQLEYACVQNLVFIYYLIIHLAKNICH